jgi:hypothetical protein
MTHNMVALVLFEVAQKAMTMTNVCLIAVLVIVAR